MDLYFRVYVKDEKDILEIRRYLEVYASGIGTGEAEGKSFRVKASPLIYEHLFRTAVSWSERGWEQQSGSVIPDSLDDVVEKVELCEFFHSKD